MKTPEDEAFEEIERIQRTRTRWVAVEKPQDEIEHMWKVASNNPNHDSNWHDPVVVAFAKLVAEREREACAKVADHWVGLTDEERKEIWWSCEQQTPTTFVKAIEQALKERNT